MRRFTAIGTVLAVGTASLAGGVVAAASASAADAAIIGTTDVYPTLLSTSTASGPKGTDVIRLVNAQLKNQALSSASLVGCTNTGAPTITASSVALDTSGFVATMTFPRPTFTDAKKAAACTLNLNGQGLVGGTVTITYSPNAPVISTVSPVGYAQTPATAPSVTLTGSNLVASSTTSNSAPNPVQVPSPNGVFFTNCQGVGLYPYSTYAASSAATLSGPTLRFAAPLGITASDCDIVLAVPSASGATGNKFDLVASLSSQPGGGFTWYPVLQGVSQVYPTLLPTTNASGSDTIRVVGSASPTLGSQLTAPYTASLDNCTNTTQPSYQATSVVLSPTPAEAVPQNGGQSNTVATLAFPHPTFTEPEKTASCSLLLGGAQPGLSAALIITYSPEAPVITSVTPSSFGQTPTIPPLISLGGSNFVAPYQTQAAMGAAPLQVPPYTSVYMTNCMVTDASKYPPNTINAPTSAYSPGSAASPAAATFASSTLLQFHAANGVLSSECDIVVPIPSASPMGGAVGTGYDLVASLNPTAGFEWVVPYQGAITLTISNPYDGTGSAATPRSGIEDADLYIGILGTPGPGPTKANGSVSQFTGTGWQTLPFTSITGYDATSHTAQLTITPQFTSGDIYFLEYYDDTSTPTTPDPRRATPPDPRTSTTVRYGFIEFSYTNTAMNVDTTLIDQIGVMMTTTQSWQGHYIPGSYQDTGCLVDLVNAVSNTGVTMATVTKWLDGTPPSQWPPAGKWTSNDLGSDFGGVIGASKIPAAYPSVQTYVQGIQNALTPLTINDLLGNSPKGSEAQNGVFSYTATYYPNGGTVGNVTLPQSDVWALTGTIGGGNSLNPNGPVQGPLIVVEGASLYAQGSNGGTGYSVYGQDGPFQVYLATGTNTYGAPQGWGNGAQVTPVQPPPPAPPVVDYTNTVKTIFRDFITPFANGLWGSTVKPFAPGTSTGPLTDTFTVDPRTSAFNVAQPNAAPGTYAWNAFQQAVVENTNQFFANNATYPNTGLPTPAVYGMPYGDTMLPPSMSPLLSYATADGWNVTLGDPAGCDDQGSLSPSRQSVQSVLGRPIVPLKAGTLAAGTELSEMVEYTATGFTGPVTYSLTHQDGSPVLLPAGLSFHRSTGVISGTPKAAMAPVPLVVTGTDGSSSATARLTFGVGSRVITPSLQSVVGRVGAAITPTTAYTAQRFASTPRYSVSPALPKGLVMDARTGVVSGTPTAAQPVTTYLVTATAPDGTAQANLTIEVDPAFTITPASQSLSGTVGQPLSGAQEYATTGFTTAPVYSVTPALPAGLSIDPATGLISGTPTTPVPTSTYQVTAKSASGSDFASVTITVTPATRRLTPSQQDAVWQVGTYGASVPLNPSGFSGPVTMSLAPSSLPAGLSFSPTTGVISGTPTQSAASTLYTVTARGTTSQATASINVTVQPAPAPPPDLGWCSPATQTVTGTVGSPLTTSPLTIGAPAPVYVLANGSPALPAGLTGPGYSTGVISGTPTASGTTTVQIHCQGQSGYQAFASVTFVIANG